MPTMSTAEYLEYANLQMAAEAFIRNETTGELATTADAIVVALIAGNKRSLKFTRPQAEAYADPVKGWTVLDQKANTNTGFSGTLFKNNQTGELVLSFRSTEFIDDHARDNKATNDLEIDGTGFALGQIADMEAWYAELAANPAMLAGKTYSVTGYSLGGHLATVFNQLRQATPSAATLEKVITFNGAGVGKIGNGSLTGMVDRFVQLRAMAAGAEGLASLFLTVKGKQAYQALREAIAASGGVPTAALRELVAGVFGTLGDGDTLTRADRDRLLGADGALTRALKVAGVAVDIPALNAGVEGTAKPTRVPDARIAAESIDYQLAVLATQSEFNTRSRLTAGDILSVLTSGGIAKAYGEPRLGNQTDVVGWEYSADTPVALVAHSLWHYGTDVRLFIEDQPNVRNGIVAAVASASTAAGDFRPLVEGFATRDFGDDHSLVLIVDSLNVQSALLNLVTEGQRTSMGETLNAILKNASWRTGVDGSNGGANAQGQAEGDVLENVVNALADLTLGPGHYTPLKGSPDGNTWASIDNPPGYSGREDFYALLNQVAGSDAYGFLGGAVTLAPATRDAVKAARDDFAAFAALYSLSPFVLKGAATADAEAALAAAWGNVYLDWAADQAARLAGSANLNFTDTWIADRQDFLDRKDWFNQRNLNPADERYVVKEGDPGYLKDSVHFEDGASGYVIQQGPLFPNDRRYYFGGPNGGSFTGGGIDDHLYGGIGNDSLDGAGGGDSLFGFAGEDLLDGGEGNDLVVGGAGNDLLDGVAGNDELQGGQGNDVQRGGQDDDTLTAYGAGNTLAYNVRVGTDRIHTNATGDNPADIIHFDDFDPRRAMANAPFERIEFDDGAKCKDRRCEYGDTSNPINDSAWRISV